MTTATFDADFMIIVMCDWQWNACCKWRRHWPSVHDGMVGQFVCLSMFVHIFLEVIKHGLPIYNGVSYAIAEFILISHDVVHCKPTVLATLHGNTSIGTIMAVPLHPNDHQADGEIPLYIRRSWDCNDGNFCSGMMVYLYWNHPIRLESSTDSESVKANKMIVTTLFDAKGLFILWLNLQHWLKNAPGTWFCYHKQI